MLEWQWTRTTPRLSNQSALKASTSCSPDAVTEGTDGAAVLTYLPGGRSVCVCFAVRRGLGPVQEGRALPLHPLHLLTNWAEQRRRGGSSGKGGEDGGGRRRRHSGASPGLRLGGWVV